MSHDQDGRHAHICWQTFKIFFSRIERPMKLKLGMQHRIVEYCQVCSNGNPGLTMTYFTARSNLVLLYGEKVKTMHFSGTIVVCDIKVSRCSKLNEYMKLNEYQRSRSFIDLGPDHSDSIFSIFLSSVTADFNISSALRWAIQDQWFSGFVFFFIKVLRRADNKSYLRWSYIYWGSTEIVWLCHEVHHDMYRRFRFICLPLRYSFSMRKFMAYVAKFSETLLIHVYNNHVFYDYRYMYHVHVPAYERILIHSWAPKAVLSPWIHCSWKYCRVCLFGEHTTCKILFWVIIGEYVTRELLLLMFTR